MPSYWPITIRCPKYRRWQTSWGDSLALSVRAQSVDAEIILFAGVHFMAETAKVLCPGKKVLIPCPEAGCSLAESCDARDLRPQGQVPGHTVVSYVNTTVGSRR